MATEKIRIAYSGEALNNGSMDVLDLAPALIAFSGLVQRANKVICNDFNVSIRLSADDIHKGSFDFQLEVVQTLLQQVKLFMQNMDDSGVKALLEIFGYGACAGKGIFWLLKKINGRKVSKIEETDNTVKMYIKDDPEPLTISKNLYEVLRDYEARTQIERIIAPLKKDGIDGFEIRDNQNIENKTPLIRVDKDEKFLFDTPSANAEEETNIISGQKMILSIVGIVFEEDQKWRFSDGENTFWAKIEDEAFWKAVESGEKSFTKGDRLKVEITTTQHIDKEGKFTATKIINKVIDHIQVGKQIVLDFE